jgi:hypothetical protein
VSLNRCWCSLFSLVLQGMIEYIGLEGREIITAGEDGYVKRWKFDKLEFAEASEEVGMPFARSLDCSVLARGSAFLALDPCRSQ